MRRKLEGGEAQEIPLPSIDDLHFAAQYAKKDKNVLDQLNKQSKDDPRNLWSKLTELSSAPLPINSPSAMEPSDTEDEDDIRIRKLVQGEAGNLDPMTDVEMSEMSDAGKDANDSSKKTSGFIDIADMYRREFKQKTEEGAVEEPIRGLAKIGVLSSVLGDVCVVRGLQDHSGIVDTGNEVFVDVTGSNIEPPEIEKLRHSDQHISLGSICDIFGPVSEPNYAVLLNSELSKLLVDKSYEIVDKIVSVDTSGASWALGQRSEASNLRCKEMQETSSSSDSEKDESNEIVKCDKRSTQRKRIPHTPHSSSFQTQQPHTQPPHTQSPHTQSPHTQPPHTQPPRQQPTPLPQLPNIVGAMKQENAISDLSANPRNFLSQYGLEDLSEISDSEDSGADN